MEFCQQTIAHIREFTRNCVHIYNVHLDLCFSRNNKVNYIL